MPIMKHGKKRVHYRNAQTVIADAMAHLNRQVKAGMTRAELDANAEAWMLLLHRYLALSGTTPTTPHPLSRNAERPRPHQRDHPHPIPPPSKIASASRSPAGAHTSNNEPTKTPRGRGTTTEGEAA